MFDKVGGKKNQSSIVSHYFVWQYCIETQMSRVNIVSSRINATFMAGFYDRVDNPILLQ